MKNLGLHHIGLCRIICGTIAIIASLVIGVLYIHHVPQTITAQDEIYIKKIVQDYGADSDSLFYSDSFEKQIDTIRALQNAAYHTSPVQAKIPINHPREPKDLYEFTHAQCSDRARFLHKALRHYGFETRYISLYEIPEDTTKIGALLRYVNSHAFIEAKTSKGWMMVDTNNGWIALDQENSPISIKQWSATPPPLRKQTRWHESVHDKPYRLLENEFTYIIGLYSRHGKFYPPYTPFIPDINWPEFIQSDH